MAKGVNVFTLEEVLKSIIVESNPAIDPHKVDGLVKKYWMVTKKAAYNEYDGDQP